MPVRTLERISPRLGGGHRAIPYAIQRALVSGLCLIPLIYQPIILIYRGSRTHRFCLDCDNGVRWRGKSMRCEFLSKCKLATICRLSDSKGWVFNLALPRVSLAKIAGENCFLIE
jgi:hypothetical protein